MIASPRVASLALTLALLGLGACASEPVIGAGPLRVVVRPAQPASALPEIVAAAEAASGKPVRYLAASGEGWHALSIDCGDPADCSAAFDRLRADRRHFSAVQVDARKRIVAPHY
jgi:hypothetical protein